MKKMNAFEKGLGPSGQSREGRDYLIHPRRSTEFDGDHRGDIGDFEPSLTKQADAESCDINHIMKRYESTGQLPDMIRGEPSYGDFSDVGTFQESLNVVMHAREQFYALDAKVRARFGNDPAQMLEFCSNPGNAEEMIKLGLALPRTPEAPIGAVLPEKETQRSQPKPKGAKAPPLEGDNT